MADYSETLGLDRARLERRMQFLADRADWHRRRDTPFDLACAATLIRDEGFIALLLGDTGRARRDLTRAGDAFAAVGLYAGHLLLSIAAPDSAAEGIGGAAIDRFVTRFQAEDEDVTPAEALPPFERDSARSPRQLLNLYQAVRGRRAPDRRSGFAAEAASVRLRLNAGIQVGLAGTPLGTYLPLFDRAGINESTPRDIDTLYAAAIRRRELIEAAQTDEYHWRMLLRPAELVDLDMMALAMNAIEAGGSSSATLAEIGERLGPVAALPILLAQDLVGTGRLRAA